MLDLAPALQIASAVVLLLLSAPAVRLVLHRRFRRMFPEVSRYAGLAVCAWAVAIASLWLWLPAMLPWLAAAGAIIALGLLWRSRPSFGRSQRLPPGSLSLTDAVVGLSDRDFYRRRIERHGPIFKTAQFTANTVCILGLDRARRLFRDHAEAIGPSPLPFAQKIMGGFLRYMEGPDHERYGGLFRKAISARVAAAAEADVRDIVRRELECLPTATEDDVRAAGIPPRPALSRVAYDALLVCLFGITPQSADYARFEAKFEGLANFSLKHSLTRSNEQALADVRNWVLHDLAVDANRPCVLSELKKIDPALPDAICADNLIFMLKIASGNVRGFLVWLVTMYADHPEWHAELRAATDRPHAGDAVDAFIHETLRLAQSEYLYRRVVRDIDFDGYRIPKGWLIRICIAESHRDPAVFADPDRFTDRFVGCPAAKATLSPFGIDRHACNSVGLVMMISRVFLGELAARPQLNVSASMPVEHDLRHWSHWRPNATQRMAFTAE